MDATKNLNEKGKQLLKEIVNLRGEPVLVIGEPGMGKSVLARAVGQELGQKTVSINASQGMRVDYLIGYPRVIASDKGHMTVTHEDGLLTQAIRQGWLFLFEELTRAPQELLSRFYGLLEPRGQRTWSVYENGEFDIPISDDFMFMATANPVGRGLYTNRIDRALERRFRYIVEVNDPLALEVQVLAEILDDKVLANKLVKFANELRRSPTIRVNTGDLVHCAHSIAAGFQIERAIETSIMPKYPGEDETVKAAFKAFFGQVGKWGG